MRMMIVNVVVEFLFTFVLVKLKISCQSTNLKSILRNSYLPITYRNTYLPTYPYPNPSTQGPHFLWSYTNLSSLEVVCLTSQLGCICLASKCILYIIYMLAIYHIFYMVVKKIHIRRNTIPEENLVAFLAFCTGFARNEFGLLTIIRIRICYWHCIWILYWNYP